MLLFSIYEELTNVVCVSDVDFCAWADVNAPGNDGQLRIGVRPAACDLTLAEGDQLIIMSRICSCWASARFGAIVRYSIYSLELIDERAKSCDDVAGKCCGSVHVATWSEGFSQKWP